MNMSSQMIANNENVIDVARGHVYNFFAAALADPLGRHFQASLSRQLQKIAIAASQLLASEAPLNITLTQNELSPRLLDLASVVDELLAPERKFIDQHQDLFGLVVGKNAPPHETEYCHTTEIFYRTQHLADAAGFYKAFGFKMNPEKPERQDHIAVQFEFMSRLIELSLNAGNTNQEDICIDAQKKFLKDHIIYWIPVFAGRIRTAVTKGLYAELAHALASFIPLERNLFKIDSSQKFAYPEPDPELAECVSCPINIC
jgi:TorA maturation chaperone TorD